MTFKMSKSHQKQFRTAKLVSCMKNICNQKKLKSNTIFKISPTEHTTDTIAQRTSFIAMTVTKMQSYRAGKVHSL
jgi:hypothetical protein